jgi:hypothetical protein
MVPQTSARPSAPHDPPDTREDDNRPTAPGLRARWSWVLFAFLTLAVLALSLDLQGLWGVGDPKKSSAVADTSITRAWGAADSSARQFLEREHQAIISEIQLRIQLEHLLFALKFALVGGTLYLLFQQAFKKTSSRFQRNEFTSLISWAAVVAAAIVDLRLAMNTTFITTLGSWVRQYENLRLGPNGVLLGWEAFLANHLLSQQYYSTLRVSSQILTALLFCVTSAMFYLSPGHPDRGSRSVSFIGAVLSIVLMATAAYSLRPNHTALFTDVAAGSIAALMVGILGVGTRAPARTGARASASPTDAGPSATPSDTQVTPPKPDATNP